MCALDVWQGAAGEDDGVDRQETAVRISKLQEAMAAQQIDGIMISQNVDVYYFTGSMQAGYVFVPARGEAVFFVKRSVVRAEQEAFIRVLPLGSFRAFGELLIQTFPEVWSRDDASKPVIAAEYDVLPVQQLQRLQAVTPPASWCDGSAVIRRVRMKKSAYEVGRIREAAHLIDAAFEKALLRLKPGITELEWMAGIEHDIRIGGHMGVMRMRAYNQETITGVIVAGEAAATPTYFDGPAGGLGLGPAGPQSASRRPIKQGEPILADIGCCIDGYVIDQTRTVVIGSLPEHLNNAYVQAERILRSAEKSLKPGAVCEQLYLDSVRMAEEAGLGKHYMGYAGDQVRFLGHGIGLEVDELPVLAKGFKEELQAGMVIAVEPKFTFPGEGVVGIENSYLITEQGCEKLTITREGLIQI